MREGHTVALRRSKNKADYLLTTELPGNARTFPLTTIQKEHVSLISANIACTDRLDSLNTTTFRCFKYTKL